MIRPCAACVHDDARRRTLFGAPHEADAEACRGVDVAAEDLHRADESVARTVGAADDGVVADGGIDRARIIRADHLRVVQSEFVLDRLRGLTELYRRGPT